VTREFPSSEKLKDALTYFAGNLDSIDLANIAICGNYAAHLHDANDRLIDGIEFLADYFPKFLLGNRDFADTDYSYLTINAPNGVPICVRVRDAGDFFSDLCRAALRQSTSMEGVPFRVVPLVYQIAMRMFSRRFHSNDDLSFMLLALPSNEYPRLYQVVQEHLGPYAAAKLEKMIFSLEKE